MARLTPRLRGLLGWAELILVAGERAVEHCRAAFLGIDVAKTRNAIAIAVGGRGGEVRYFGGVEAAPDNVRRIAFWRTFGKKTGFSMMFFRYEWLDKFPGCGTPGSAGFGVIALCRGGPRGARCRGRSETFSEASAAEDARNWDVHRFPLKPEAEVLTKSNQDLHLRFQSVPKPPVMHHEFRFLGDS